MEKQVWLSQWEESQFIGLKGGDKKQSSKTHSLVLVMEEQYINSKSRQQRQAEVPLKKGKIGAYLKRNKGDDTEENIQRNRGRD